MPSLISCLYFITLLVVQALSIDFDSSSTSNPQYLRKWITSGLRCRSEARFFPISESSDCTHAIALIPSQRPTNVPNFSFRMPAAFRAGSCIVAISLLHDPTNYSSHNSENLPLWADAKALAQDMVHACISDRRRGRRKYNYALLDSESTIRHEGDGNQLHHFTRLSFRVTMFGLPSHVKLGEIGSRREQGWVDNVTHDMGFNLYQAVGIAPPGGMANWDRYNYQSYKSNGASFTTGNEVRVDGYNIYYVRRTGSWNRGLSGLGGSAQEAGG
jgi:hypothetical protein